MAVSDNGYLVDPSPAALGVVAFAVNGVSFGGGVTGGDVHAVLHYVASQVAERVEAPDASLGCYGYAYRANVNNPGVWSNHASGTAIDYNASSHGNGSAATSSWTFAQITEIHKILAEVNNVVRWGGDYNSTPDSMHFEINVVPAVLAIEAADLPATGGTGGGDGGGGDGTAAVVGADDWADAPTLPYGYRSAPTPSDGLTADTEDIAWGAAKSAWWKVTVPADHNPDVTVRVTCQRTYIDVPGDPGDNDGDDEYEVRIFTGSSRETLDRVDRGMDCWESFNPGDVFYIEVYTWDDSPEASRHYVVEVADQTFVYSDWIQGPNVSTGWKNTTPARTDYRTTSVGFGGTGPGQIADSPVDTAAAVIDELKALTAAHVTNYISGVGGAGSIGAGAFGSDITTHAQGHLGAGDYTGFAERIDQGGLFAVNYEDLRFSYQFTLITPPGASMELEGGLFSTGWQVLSADVQVPLTGGEYNFFPGSETGITLGVKYWTRPANAYNDSAETPTLIGSHTFGTRGTWMLEASLTADQMKNGVFAIYPVIDYAITGAWTGFAPQPASGGLYETGAAYSAVISAPGSVYPVLWPDGAPYTQVRGLIKPPRHRFRTQAYTTIEPGGGSTGGVVAEFAITVDESGWIFSFDGSLSSADPGSIVSWTWDFADPVAYDPAQPVEGEFVDHIFEAVPATYVVTLTVVTDGGETASVSHPVVASGGLITENPLDDYRYFTG